MKLKQIRVDGYKNLINCELNLGDFNVLVGPNNSGKSNLLEAIQMFFPVCFGNKELRDTIFKGRTPPPRLGSSVCHLTKHSLKPMTIGIAFEVAGARKAWTVDYEVTIQCGEDKKNVGFVKELLTAKEVRKPGKKGAPNTYISRQEKELRVREDKRTGLRKHLIAKDNSSLLAMESLYPDFEGLPAEYEAFVEAIGRTSGTKIFAISPKGMRDAIHSEKPMDGIQVSSFDLLLAADEMKKEGKHYDLFKEILEEILDLENVFFSAEDMPTLSVKDKGREKSKRMRLFALKRKGDKHSLVDEYSDGTLAVISILEALLSVDGRGPILCLEELENCLHPAAIEKLLRFLQDHAEEWPVLITTHSPYLLNGIKPEDVNVAVIDKTGAVHFEKVRDTKTLRDYLKSDFMSLGDLLPSNFEDVLGGR